MDMNDILKSIGQKQSQEKKKAAPRVQMIHYTKLKPSPDNFYDTEGIEKLAAAIRIAMKGTAEGWHRFIMWNSLE